MGAQAEIVKMLAPAETIANTPDRMCWLCRREIEVSRPGKFRGHRPSICRVITFYPSSQSSIISGIGYRVPTDAPSGLAFTVPRRISASLTSPPSTPEKVDLVTTTGRSPSSPSWTFPVHADCWELLTARISPHTCATILSKALVTLNWNWSFPSSIQQRNTNDYSLPRLFLSPSPPYSKTYHRRASLQQPQTFYGLAVELGLSPFDLSPVSQVAVKIPDPHPLSIAAIKAKSEDVNCPWDIFSALSIPIIQNILRFVRTSDIPNLRLASKAIARAARVDTLPQAFWVSRFWPEFEMGFAMPEDGYYDEGGHGERDWNGLYFAVKEATRAEKRPFGADGAVNVLKKRKFWWERLGAAARFCERWKHMTLKGEQFCWVEQLDRDEGVFLVLREMGCVSALLLHDDGTPREAETEMPLMGKFGKGSAVVASFDDFRMVAFGVAELIPSCD
ncbi:hypothetical protein B0T16DRAFT_393405 [Cercophora newfieldiana]|uniref:F-box domain-containing protein n=1 Tax=Cercophora newfieldiana TaxID=92897 RepID=A0AA39XVV1_9PEZI|nr:hypothetical protein B0T16DRAFT_393405 [Cercophora newfieldiana]